jgi:hypothetical protein
MIDRTLNRNKPASPPLYLGVEDPELEGVIRFTPPVVVESGDVIVSVVVPVPT